MSYSELRSIASPPVDLYGKIITATTSIVAPAATISNLTLTNVTTQNATVTGTATINNASIVNETVGISAIGTGTVTDLTSTTGSITTLATNSLTALNATVTNLTSTSANITNGTITSGTIPTLGSTNATITNLGCTGITTSSINGGTITGTSSTLSAQPYLQAVTNGAQAIGNSVVTLLNAAWDLGSSIIQGLSFAGGVCTISSAGTYFISFECPIAYDAPPPNGFRSIFILINGLTPQYTVRYEQVTQAGIISVISTSFTRQLAIGDTVAAYAYCSINGATVNVGTIGPDNAYFCVAKLF